MAKAIPDGFTSITPYLIVKDAAAGLEFYKKAFSAEELLRLPDPSGKVCHAEMKIGNAIVMLADEFPEMNILGPQTRGGPTASLLIYVEDVEASFQQAVRAGATVQRPLADQFYGDRSATLIDPFGHQWTVATHMEDVPAEVMNQRFEEMMKQKKPS